MKRILKMLVMMTVLISTLLLSACLDESPRAGSEWPVGGYSFGGNFDNWAEDRYDLMNFGNLAFTDKGIIDKGLEMSNGYLEIKDSTKLVLKDGFSFSAWVKMNERVSGEPMLFCRESSGGDIAGGPISIRFSENYEYLRTDISFVMADKRVESYSFASGFVFSNQSIDNSWHHIGVVFDKSELSYYVDGKLTSTEKLPDYLKGYKSIANTNKNFTIGRGSVDNLKAVIDEVRFYDDAISMKAMEDIYSEVSSRYSNKIVMRKDSKEIYVNGKLVESPVEVTEDAATERLMIPIRIIVESMGGTVSWDGEDGMGRADIVLGDTNISIWLYDTNAIVNNRYCKMEAYPTKINDTTCVPVRFIGEEMGALVEWKEDTQEVVLLF